MGTEEEPTTGKVRIEERSASRMGCPGAGDTVRRGLQSNPTILCGVCTISSSFRHLFEPSGGSRDLAVERESHHIGIFVKESPKQTLSYSPIHRWKMVPHIKPSCRCQGGAMSPIGWELGLPRAPHLALVKAKQPWGWTMQWCSELDFGNQSRKTVGVLEAITSFR